ncbi:MAG: cytochrome-c oxidase, cbb3-type subunit I [Puniceicoccaceae bacterium]
MSDAHLKLVEYDDRLVRFFLVASIFWGLVGMLVGVLIAFQLNFHQLNFDLSFFSFGRLRPLHTNAAIFAFVGNMMFAGIYYSTQRLCKCRTASDTLGWIHFWGWQAIIVAAAITLPLGFTRGKEYAELIWPINIAVVLIWVVFAVNFFWTLMRRNEPTLYVAIWFYIATIVTVAMLYIVNHLSIPTSLVHSYPIFGGLQDALVQWWYGHNAVAFFLTTPILGIMYYFVPKAAGRPVYSYRLSVIHFWSLVFVYIWAGPHHLLHTALPGWLQGLGMLFSLMLWAPSWGGMLNGLLTLRGAWDKLRTDPVVQFLAAGVTFYGMATFEGPLLSIKDVNALSHYTDWTIGHVHSGTLGWNGFIAAGMFYWLAPRLWGTQLYSKQLAHMHFYIGMLAILLYIGSMWVSGITQGLMLNATNADGTGLLNPNFIESLSRIRPMMLTRALGGALYLLGYVLLAYNIFMTARAGKAVNGTVEVVAPDMDPYQFKGMGAYLNAPVLYAVGILVSSMLWLFGGGLVLIVGMLGTFGLVLLAIVHFELSGARWVDWYERLLGNALPFTVLTLIAAAIGGAVQIIPTVVKYKDDHFESHLQVPYTPLELAGRDLYIREGCYNCHSQMIRTLVPDVLRYGDNSKPGESIYNHPFQWGSKRTGPDLAREGGPIVEGKQFMRIGFRDNVWHFDHMFDPRSTSDGSNMPAYPWLYKNDLDLTTLPRRIEVLRLLGVPYPKDLGEAEIHQLVDLQAREISRDLRSRQKFIEPEKEIVALIAYLQAIGNSGDPLEVKALASEMVERLDK